MMGCTRFTLRVARRSVARGAWDGVAEAVIPVTFYYYFHGPSLRSTMTFIVHMCVHFCYSKGIDEYLSGEDRV